MLDTWVQCLSIRYLSELSISISSSASQMVMCDAYLRPMSTARGMSYEPSDICGYQCEPKGYLTVAHFENAVGSMAIVNFLCIWVP